MNKEVYIVLCKSLLQADYWRAKFELKFHDDFFIRDNHRNCTELYDSIWYFKSEQIGSRIKGIVGYHDAIVYPQEAIYIILDDPERKRLDTYEGY